MSEPIGTMEQALVDLKIAYGARDLSRVLKQLALLTYYTVQMATGTQMHPYLSSAGEFSLEDNADIVLTIPVERLLILASNKLHVNDPVITPAYVAKAKWLHEKAMDWTILDPMLPKWTSVAPCFDGQRWELGKDMQGYARPDGAKRSMVYDKESGKWEPRPKVAKDAETSKQAKASKIPSEEGLKSKKSGEKGTSKAAKGTIKEADDVKKEKATKEEQPDAEKMTPLKASSAKRT